MRRILLALALLCGTRPAWAQLVGLPAPQISIPVTRRAPSQTDDSSVGYTAAGHVLSIAVTAPGTGYTSAPTVTLSAPPAGSVQATATATVSGGAVTAITVVVPGTNYPSAPTVTLSGGGGSGATAVAALTQASLWRYGSTWWQIVDDTPGQAVWQTIPVVQYPAAAAPLTDVWATRQISSTYAGNLFALTRASDATTKAIGQLSGGMADSPTADAFCSGTTCRYTTIYGQVVSYDLTAAFSSAPLYLPGVFNGNAPSIIFDTNPYGAGAGYTSEQLTIPSGVTTTAAAVTAFALVRHTNGNIQTPVLDLIANTSSDLWFDTSTLATPRGLFLGYINISLLSGIAPPLTPSLEGFSMSGTDTILFGNHQQILSPQAGYSGFSLAGGQVGLSRQEPNPGFFETSFIGFANTALTGAQIAALQNATDQAFGLYPQNDGIIEEFGDSMTAGVGSTGAPYGLQTDSRQTLPLLREPMEWDTSGASGATMAALVANLPGWAQNNFARAARNKIFVGADGTNDIAAGTTAATLESLVQQQASLAITAGAKKYIATTIPCSRTSFTAPEVTQCQTYNAWLRANWPAFAAALADFDANPAISSRMSDTTFSPDGTHFYPLGNAFRARILATAINSAIAD